MSYREMSSWVMGALTAALGLHYLSTYLDAAQGAGGAPPAAATFIPYVIVVVAASITAQIVLAILAPKRADTPPDERERPLLDRAGHWAGVIQAVLAVTALVTFMHREDGALLFHMIVGGLILAQVAEYALQIILLRWGS